jgi:hypothetical protein
LRSVDTCEGESDTALAWVAGSPVGPTVLMTGPEPAAPIDGPRLDDVLVEVV